MTDLDRQIAEAKGWRAITREDISKGMSALQRWCPLDNAVLCRDRPDGGIDFGTERPGDPTWSTSDSKALELVDELGRHDPSRMWKYFFRMDQLENGQGWRAVFWEDLGGRMIPPRKFTGQGMRRPEAICRAYLAAMAWMRGRG